MYNKDNFKKKTVISLCIAFFCTAVLGYSMYSYYYEYLSWDNIGLIVLYTILGILSFSGLVAATLILKGNKALAVALKCLISAAVFTGVQFGVAFFINNFLGFGGYLENIIMHSNEFAIKITYTLLGIMVGIIISIILKSLTKIKILPLLQAVILILPIISGLWSLRNIRPAAPNGPKLDLTGYELVFEDEFKGTELNEDIWRHRAVGARRGGFNSPETVEVKDGNLILTAEYLKDGTMGKGWYGGMVALNEKYCKGYFEIKCKVSAGGGFWSAFWLQADHPYEAVFSKGGVGGAEIDIFEAFGWGKKAKHGSVEHNLHCAGVDGKEEGFQSKHLGSFYGKDIFEEYNTYGLMWTDEEYIFYINGVETTRSTFGNGVSEVPEEVIVSLEIPEVDLLDVLDKETYRSQFIVDYVRIYQLAD